MKLFFELIGFVALLAGCSSMDNSGTGGTGNVSYSGSSTGNGSNHGVSSQGSGSGAGGVENNAQKSGVGTGTIGAGKP